jgi:hypothetical protein
MRVTLEEFLRGYPSPDLAGPAERQESNFLSGIERLPLSLA